MLSKEFELKILINKNIYERLLLKSYKTIKQTNYYFDNKNNDIYNNMCSLRIREKNNEYEITLKTLGKEHSFEAVNNVNEENIKISKDDFNKIILGNREINEFINMKYTNMNYIGKLYTERSLISVSDNIGDMELDFNMYNGLTDYELEWEISEDLYDEAIKLLKKMNIDIDKQKTGKSKFVRFIKSLNIDLK